MFFIDFMDFFATFFIANFFIALIVFFAIARDSQNCSTRSTHKPVTYKLNQTSYGMDSSVLCRLAYLTPGRDGHGVACFGFVCLSVCLSVCLFACVFPWVGRATLPRRTPDPSSDPPSDPPRPATHPSRSYRLLAGHSFKVFSRPTTEPLRSVAII